MIEYKMYFFFLERKMNKWVIIDFIKGLVEYCDEDKRWNMGFCNGKCFEFMMNIFFVLFFEGLIFVFRVLLEVVL